MPDSAAFRPGRWFRAWQPYPVHGQAGRPGWLPVWSVPAAMRALRAAIVVPSLFALTFEVIGDPQMALFAMFGSFGTAGTGTAAHSGPRTVWVRDHLQHLGSHAQAITAPASRVAQQRRVPWGR